jgi:two-component system nitrate/nitrite sensor histidine kinase NarX
MSWISSLSNLRDRHPLYSGLAAVLAGCVLSGALTLLGSVEVQRQLDAGLATLVDACTSPQPTDTALCQTLRAVERVLNERVAVILLMQGLCFALMLGGAWLIIARAHRVLVQRPHAALGLVNAMARGRGGDEIEQLIHSLEDMSARQAGLEAEGRWERQLMTERVRRNTQALNTLHEVARMFSHGDVSEFSLLNALTLLESALGAQTVALCLGSAARTALSLSAVLSTHGEPLLANELARDRGVRDSSARVVPPAPGCEHLSLVVPVWRGDDSVGTLVAEFPGSLRVDNAQIQLAETFAHLAALAISGISRSQEERRVALMEERSAIAAELHDSLAQSLAFMKIQVARLQSGLALLEQPADVTQAARELRAGLSAAYREVRELIAAFRVRMGPGGWVAAVQDAVDEFSQRSALDIRFDTSLGGCQLHVNEEFHLVQVIREALSNAVRHARAQRVWIVAAYGPEHRLVVAIEDDGRGPEAPASDDGHYGLSIMRERARTLNGDMNISPREGGGTRVQLAFSPQRLPMHATDTDTDTLK